MKDKTTAEHFNKKWTEIIKLMPHGGRYDFTRRSYGFNIICDKIKPKSKVFDYACGLGVMAKMLVEEKGCDVSGCDFSQVAIDYCKKTIDGDFREIDDFFGGEYDVIIASQIIEHMEAPAEWLSNAMAKADRVICAIPRNFHRHGEHINMAWSGWVSFHDVFKGFKYKRLDLKKGRQFNTFKDDDNLYPNGLGEFAHPIIEFYK